MSIPVVAFALASVAWSATRLPRFQAEARVLLADSAAQATLDPSSQNTGFLSRELSNEISLAHSDLVESRVLAELSILPAIKISGESDADVLIFRATAGTANDAAVHANTWAEQYIQIKRGEAVGDIAAATASLQARLEDLRSERQRIREPLDELDSRIGRAAAPEVAADLQRQYDRLADDLRYELELVTGQAEATVASLTDLELRSEFAAVGEARLVQVAAPPLSTSNPPLTLHLALGMTLGLLAGFGLALLAESRDGSIKTAAEIAAITDLPVLASIPGAPKKRQESLPTATHLDPEGVYADAYHKVRSAIEFASLEGELKTVLVTSAGASEGKTTSSSNLALAFASVGKRTVLVDVDFRRARLHEIYGIPHIPGLSDVVRSEIEMSSVAYTVDEAGLESLLVIPAGTPPPSPAAFVGTNGFKSSIQWIKSEADVVVLDAPPILAVSDPHTMAKHMDAIVLTVRAKQTTRNELTEVLSALAQVGANPLGIMLVGVDDGDSQDRHYTYRSQTMPKAGPKKASTAMPLWGKNSTTPSADIDLVSEDAELLTR